MKKRIILFILMQCLLFCLISCQRPTQNVDSEDTKLPENDYKQPYMAQQFGNMYRVGDDLYFLGSKLSGYFDVNKGEKGNVLVTEYGAEKFDYYVPCFDSLCTHFDRSRCCLYTCDTAESLYAYEQNGEPTIVIYSPLDTVTANPYLNIKQDLLCEDFVYSSMSKLEYLKNMTNSPDKYSMLVYKDYLYYSMLVDDDYISYRLPLVGGEPERVFTQDSVIIKTIINDRFYGIKFNSGNDFDDVVFFRCNMDLSNFEILPAILTDFSVLNTTTTAGFYNTILGADDQYIYIISDRKLWALSDSDINVSATVLADLAEVLPDTASASVGIFGNGNTAYILSNENVYRRDLHSAEGRPKKEQWYETSKLYCLNIKTGTCTSTTLTDSSYLFLDIFFADDEYVYGYGKYVHEDGRFTYSIIRLTLDNMKYEVLLADSFLSYTSDTTAS